MRINLDAFPMSLDVHSHIYQSPTCHFTREFFARKYNSSIETKDGLVQGAFHLMTTDRLTTSRQTET